MFYGLSTHENEFAEHLNLFIGLNPVTKLPNTGPLMMNLATYYDEIQFASKEMNMYAVGMDMDFKDKMAFYNMCSMMKEKCKKMMEMPLTADPDFDDTDRFIVAMTNNGGKTPMKSMMHYG
jgi:hypothetical protein